MFLRTALSGAVIRSSIRPSSARVGIPAIMDMHPVRRYTEGATGSGHSRPGGQASGDSFTKREKANEDYYVRQRETEKLNALRNKIKEQQKHLKELEEHIDTYNKNLGGEQN